MILPIFVCMYARIKNKKLGFEEGKRRQKKKQRVVQGVSTNGRFLNSYIVLQILLAFEVKEFHLAHCGVRENAEDNQNQVRIKKETSLVPSTLFL